MKNSLLSFKTAGFILLLLTLAISAAQGANRVYLSPATGSDSNACTLASPCRQFAKALSTVATGGEVVVLDSGSFQSFTISKSVSVIAPEGIDASVATTSGTAIAVNTGSADIVLIRGIDVKGFGTAQFGIYQLDGALHIESCTVDGFTLQGIQTGSQTSALFLKDTIARNNGTGVDVDSYSVATIDHCTFDHNKLNGMYAFPKHVSIHNSEISGNGNDGISFQNSALVAQDADLNVENCVIANNGADGISVSDTGSGAIPTARISNSTITDNQVGLRQSGAGVILSRGNNTIQGNTTSTVGTIGSFAAN